MKHLNITIVMFLCTVCEDAYARMFSPQHIVAISGSLAIVKHKLWTMQLVLRINLCLNLHFLCSLDRNGCTLTLRQFSLGIRLTDVQSVSYPCVNI